MDTIDRAGQTGRRRRRRHSAEFKAEVTQACGHPGVSIAAVALSHGLNANLLRRWLIEHSPGSALLPAPMPTSRAQQTPPNDQSEFVPIKLDTGHAPAPDIRIEMRRGPSTISVSWPAQEAAACAAWLREWLR